jgi:hypothetical protein
VCKKVFVNKRKAFDTKKQRVIDSEHAALLRRGEMEEKKSKNKVGAVGLGNKNAPVNSNKKPKWQKQSEELRAILRANQTTNDFGVGNKLGNMNGKKGHIGNNTNQNFNKPSVLTEDYLHCGHCNRRYNEQAYNKHLPTCERRTKEAELKLKTKNTLLPQSKNSGSQLNQHHLQSKPSFTNTKFNYKK